MQFIINYWKTILVTLIIIVLTFASIPSLENIPKINHWDKLAHFTLYMVLTFVAMWDYDNENKNDKGKWRFILLCLCFPLFLGLLTEILQTYIIPDRFGDVYDWISNSLGVFGGWLLFVVYKKLFKT